MQPIDALTDVDKKTIKNYIWSIGNVDCGPIDQVFRVWNKNKKTLFRAFGNKLSISKRISIAKSEGAIAKELANVYVPFYFWNTADVYKAKTHFDYIQKQCENDFVSSILHYWAKKDYDYEDLFYISRLFNYRNIIKGYITHLPSDEPYKCKSFKCTIKNSMRTMRTIQKVIKATGYPYLDLFNEWCDTINALDTRTNSTAKLVLSIHPIDFMSMSDNNCNWTSCMSWKDSGCYRTGTLEMMNSNVAIVAYLEGPQTFNVYDNDENKYHIPNKTWRSLFFVHKHIILAGKPYPYQNKEVTIIVLNWLRELVKKNLNWSYQFINQPYLDVNYINSNFYLRDYFNVDYDQRKPHHNIFVYTNGMYNDIIEEHGTYLCCRNYVDHSIKLCLSGPATCICCGDVIATREDIYSYDELGSDLICDHCNTYRKCDTCGVIHYTFVYETPLGRFCSDECIKDIRYYPIFNKVINKGSEHYTTNSVIIITDGTLNFNELANLKDSFYEICGNRFVDHTVDFIQQCESQYEHRIKVYRMPQCVIYRLGRRYLDYDYNPDIIAGPTMTNSSCLYVFNKDINIEKVKKWIQDTKVYMPLIEYLKNRGEDNEGSITMN